MVSPEAKLVHGDGEVSWLIVAVVEVPVIHRDQVHVTKDEAVVICILQRLCVAHVQQFGSVECVLAQLQDKRQESNFCVILLTDNQMNQHR